MRSIALKVGIFLTAYAMPCGASEIHVLSAAVMQTVFKEAVDDFERSSGHKVVFVYATMGAITERVRGGEPADLVIGSTPSLARLVKEGKVSAQSTVTVARVGVGAVVPSGTPVPAFATPDDLRQALLAAKTVVYAKPVSPTK
jgi:molybdate transport system substrate-binding protein